MSNNNNHQLGEAPWLHVIISTGLGVGFWPWGPGTLGGFVALLIWIALYFALSPMWLAIATVLLVVGTLFVGVWTDNVMERYWGEDPRTVIIDEYFGTWVATLAALFVDGPSYVAVCLVPRNRHYETAWLPLGRPPYTRRMGLHARRCVGWLLRHLLDFDYQVRRFGRIRTRPAFINSYAVFHNNKT